MTGSWDDIFNHTKVLIDDYNYFKFNPDCFVHGRIEKLRNPCKKMTTKTTDIIKKITFTDDFLEIILKIGIKAFYSNKSIE